jgi:hypothetical protein
MPPIFMIAAPEDEPFARQVADHLQQHGYRVRVFPERGSFTWPIVRPMIQGAVVVLFIVSPDALTNQTCHHALHLAQQSGTWLIPCLYRDYFFSTELEALAEHSWTDMRGAVIRADDNLLFLEALQGISLNEDRLATGLEELRAAFSNNWAYAEGHSWLSERMRTWQRNGRGRVWRLTREEQWRAQQLLATSHNRLPAVTPEMHDYISLSPYSPTGCAMPTGPWLNGLLLMLAVVVIAFCLFSVAAEVDRQQNPTPTPDYSPFFPSDCSNYNCFPKDPGPPGVY